MQKKKRTGQVR